MMLQRRSGALQRSMHVLYSGYITAVALPWSMHIMVSIAVGYKGKGIRFIVLYPPKWLCGSLLPVQKPNLCALSAKKHFNADYMVLS